MKNTYPKLLDNVVKENCRIREEINIDTYEKCVIFGNGPSLKGKQVDLNDGSFICRTNWFFLEDKPYFGTRVDAYFCGIYNEEMLRQLAKSCYSVKRVFCPFNIFKQFDIDSYLTSKSMAEINSHWAIIAENPHIAKEFIRRPLPTQGVQMIATAAVLGFKEIQVYGVDFYSISEGQDRYCYQQTERSIGALEQKDITPGYEANHSYETDQHVLKIIKNEYPRINIVFN